MRVGTEENVPRAPGKHFGENCTEHGTGDCHLVFGVVYYK